MSLFYVLCISLTAAKDKLIRVEAEAREALTSKSGGGAGGGE